MVKTWRRSYMENDEFKELEFKYFADDIKLQDFIALVKPLKPLVRKDVSSWDTYYTKGQDKEEFQRFRQSDKPELTKKKKIKSTNNWERIESDLPLMPGVTEEQVTFHVAMDGYVKNFQIYKTCFIFWFDYINTVYYIVYDENMNERGRFIEIEVNKSKVPELGIDKAFEMLKEYEQKLLALGIAPGNRLRRSLFEIFVK